MKNAERAMSVMVLLVAASLAWAGAPGDADQPTCHACGKAITGSHFETGGNFYHPGCFTCDFCKKPIDGRYTVFKNRNYHKDCFDVHVALRCAVCGGIVEGRHLVDYWGNAYHLRHKNEVAQCDFCQRFVVGPLGNGMKRLPDGRTLCSKCAPSSVTSVREARSISADVARALRAFGIDVDPGPIEFRLVGQQELDRIAEEKSHETKGFTDYSVEKNAFGRVMSEKIKVHLLDGMPRTQVVSTVAHEFMHIWQFQNGILDQNAEVSEGSCNLASYLVLRKLGCPDADFVIDGMLKDTDRTYGQGFRRVKAYVESEGTSAWLRSLKEKDPGLSER